MWRSYTYAITIETINIKSISSPYELFIFNNLFCVKDFRAVYTKPSLFLMYYVISVIYVSPF